MIARRCGVARSTVAGVLNGDSTARVGSDTRKRIQRAAKELGYDMSRIRRIHRRASPRVRLNLPVKVAVVSGGRVHTRGAARVRTLNAAGLLLEDWRCTPAHLPLTSFHIRVSFGDSELTAPTVECVPVTLTCKGKLSIGARYVGCPPTALARLQQGLWSGGSR